MTLTPALTTISANACVLIALWGSWIASKVFSLLLVVRGAVASLEIVNNIF